MTKEDDCFVLNPIGQIFTGFKTQKDCPRNSRFNKAESVLEVDPAYKEALLGLEDVEYLIVLYWLDKADRSRLQSKPPHIDKELGVFSTRSPHRPNPIALSVVKILGIEENRIKVSGLDCIDGTPLLDLKRSIPSIDQNDR